MIAHGYSVEAACRDYVEDRRSEKNEACAHDARMRFERTVYRTAFGKMPIARLVSLDIKSWRRETGLSKSSQNRTMTALRAALNLAVQNRRVAAERRIEWASVRQHKGVNQRRMLFLDLRSGVGSCHMPRARCATSWPGWHSPEHGPEI